MDSGLLFFFLAVIILTGLDYAEIGHDFVWYL